MEGGAGGSSRRKTMPLKVRMNFGPGAKGQEKVNGSKEKQEENDVQIYSASDSDDAADIPDLPEGTVVVKPEPVQEKTIRFRGPEFKPANKKGCNGGATSNSTVLENLFCTACGRQVNPWKTGTVKKHKDLRVLICKKCYNFLESGEIAQDEDGMDEQCRWCGEGGRLTICDKCPRAYCKGCIMRNFGRAAFTAVTESENWECYCCDPEPLQELKNHCRTVFDTIKAADKKLVKSSQPSSSAPSNNSKSSPSSSSSRSSSRSQSELAGDAASLLSQMFSSVDFDEDNIVSVTNGLWKATTALRHLLLSIQCAVDSENTVVSDDEEEVAPVFSVSKDANSSQKKRKCAKHLKKGLQSFCSSVGDVMVRSKSSGNKSKPSSMPSSLAVSCNGDIPNTSSKSSKMPLHGNSASTSSNSSTNLASTSSVNPNSTSVPGVKPSTSQTEDNQKNGKLSKEEQVTGKGDGGKRKEQKRKEEERGGKAVKEEKKDGVQQKQERNKDSVQQKQEKNKDSVQQKQERNKDSVQQKQERNKDSVQQKQERNKDSVEEKKDKKKTDTKRKAEEKTKDSVEERDNKEDEERDNKKDEKASKDILRQVNNASATKNNSTGTKDKDRQQEAEVYSDPSVQDKQAKLTTEKSKSTKALPVEDEDLEESDALISESTDVGIEQEAEAKIEEAVSDAVSKTASELQAEESGPQEENLFAKLGLIKELADEFCKESEEKEKAVEKEDLKNSADSDDESPPEVSYKGSDDESLPEVSFGFSFLNAENDVQEKIEKENKDSKPDARLNDFSDISDADSTSANNQKSKKDIAKKKKEMDGNSDDDSPHRKKTVKGTRGPEKKPSASKRKEEAVVEASSERNSNSGDVSSSDLILSSEDEDERRRKRKRRQKKRKRNGTANGKQEANEDSDKDSDDKQTSKRRVKTTPKKDSKAKNKGSDDDDGEVDSDSVPTKVKKTKKCENNSPEEREKEKGVKKRARTASGKQENGSGGKKKEKTQKELDSSEEDERLQKEVDNLIKGSGKRKKKGVEEDEEDGADEEDEEDVSSNKGDEVKEKVDQAVKKGGKKKEEDSSDSSEDDKEDEEEEDEELDDSAEEMFSKPSENGTKDSNADLENKLAKAALMEEEDDNDDNDDNDDIDDDDEDKSDEDTSSSQSDEGTSKKTKGKKAGDEKKGDKSKEDEAVEEEEEEEDSDLDPGETRKRFKSNLLDAKISDSDSDIEVNRSNRRKKGKKRKRDSDNESFDGGKAGDEDDDDDDDEDEDDDDGDSVVNSDEVSSGDGGGGSDASDGSGSGKKKGKGKGKGKEKGKKRKRIKRPKDTSSDEEPDAGAEDGEEPGSRKKIRKIKSDKKLGDTTKAAARAEEDRRKRIQNKQERFNGVEQKETGDGNAPITTKLVLEQDEDGEEPLIQVNLKLIRKLKPHQVEAVQFMWDCMFESLERSRKQDGSAGCILAHCMGLGKTLSVVSFIHTVMTHKKLTKVKSCMVVSPLNTVLNWQNEFEIWLDEEDQLPVYEMASVKQNNARADVLEEWHKNGGIMIIGYEMLRNLSTGARVRNKKQKAIFQKTLIDPGPDVVVCDEGHVMKNAASALSKAMNNIKTRRRVVLTGTPLQNNLIEYHCMVDFVKPNLLGTKKEFANRFVNPITNGQHKDSTGRDVRIMKNRAHVLHELLAGCVQRRDYSALTKFLPPKQEYVISVRLSEMQVKMYEEYLKRAGLADGVITTRGAQLFKDYQNLMKIWTHPWVMKLAEIRDDLKMKYDDEDSFIDDEYSDEDKSLPSSSSSSSSEDEAPTKEKSEAEESAGEGTSLGRRSSRLRNKEKRRNGDDKDEIVKEWKTRSRGGEGEVPMEVETGPQPVSSDWWAEFVSEEDQNRLELSGKLVILFDILRMCEEIGDKVLIFSQSLLSLDIIEYFLDHIDSKFTQETENKPDEELKEEFGKRWTKGDDYFRLDGSTSAQMRQLWASIFNDPKNLRARLFLISTRAGGLGINLVGANRVIIFDASWNPSHDVQSIFRVYRFGQTKPCYIYRFLAQGTMEEKIYDRQVNKLSLSQRVVDEHQVERHFTAADLSELYSFKPERLSDQGEKKTLMLPKDVLLAEIVAGENRDWFVVVHEHDSLLENLVEQELTEEEKKAAWEEYENEKKGLRMNVGNMGQGGAGLGSYLSQEFLLQTARNLRMQHPDMPQEVLQMHLQRIIMMQIRQKQEEQRRLEMMERQQASQFMQMQQRYAQLHQQYLQQMGQQGGAPMYGMPTPGQRFSPSLYAHMAQPGISAFHGGAAAAVKNTESTGVGPSKDSDQDKSAEVIDLDGSSD